MDSNILPVAEDVIDTNAINRSNETSGTLIVSHEEMKQLDLPQSEVLPSQPSSVTLSNCTPDAVIFCWIDFSGTINNFRLVAAGTQHKENTHQGHAFVCLRSTEESELSSDVSGIVSETFLFYYKLHAAGQHSVTIFSSSDAAPVITSQFEIPREVIDTSTKEYVSKMVHGFTIHFEMPLETDETLLFALEEDLAMIESLVPQRAYNLLQRTHIYINISLTYGQNIRGRSCCYHPHDGQAWLLEHGCSVDKAGCIEIYQASEYLSDRSFWGIGGLLLHELSHAYHNKHCPNGYKCEDIIHAYDCAMQAGSYECVAAHGVETPCKGYACTNVMEYFAENSVAYHCKRSEIEYNKWYPHNCTQLQSHDECGYDVIHRMWQQHEEIE